MSNTIWRNWGAATARMVGALLSLLLITSTGCSGFAGLQDLHYCATNKSRAYIAWYSNADRTQRKALGSDYAHGYKLGFYDAATGRGCKLPAIPPPCYWSTKYQSCEGQAAIQDWYRGYQCGVTAAQAKGYPSFHAVPLGPCAPIVNETGCQGCSAPDYCNGGNCSASDSSVSYSQVPADFHGGMFGQYGSEPPMGTGPTGGPAGGGADYPVDGSPSDALEPGKGEAIQPPNAL